MNFFLKQVRFVSGEIWGYFKHDRSDGSMIEDDNETPLGCFTCKHSYAQVSLWLKWARGIQNNVYLSIMYVCSFIVEILDEV